MLIVCCVISPLGIAEWHSASRDIMGTRITLTFWEDDTQRASDISQTVFAEFTRLDQLLSPYIASSELSRINREAAKGPINISVEVMRLLDKALYFGKLTDGAFDISFASLGRFYNYREGQKPTAEQWQIFRAAIDYRKIQLDRKQGTVFFAHPKLAIDLGGIAKGYAVDKAIEILDQQGITNASISAGGDSRLLGDKQGKPWVVGIKHPRAAKDNANDSNTALILLLSNTAISTSGDYERYFMDPDSGERIHHIIKPQSGRSASGVMSVSILGAQGFDTDPLSTSVFVMGVDRGLALINRLPGFDAVIIDSRGKVHYSQGLVAP
ncbi:FAD:protein FMN transferase [Maricurvus nonylphenolicus]|uniref:FAD:protein FMN transferase n=1 Tax=Maricurvus nonylphenolicus TaxID=1008307 RepID=UPI0036F2ACC6